MRGLKGSKAGRADAEPCVGNSSRHVRRPVSRRNVNGHDEVVLDTRATESRGFDEPVNVLRARHKKTDDLLENLHRVLRDQFITRSPNTKLPILDAALSGATTPRKGRRRSTVQERARDAASEREKVERLQVARNISKTEEIISFSEGLGIDMTRPVRDIFYAQAALGRDEPTIAKRKTASAERSARDAISQRLKSLIREANTSLKQLETVCGCADPLRQLLGSARNALKNGDYAQALSSLNDAKKRIQKAENDAVLRIIADAKSKFVMAKKLRLNIDEAVSLLNKSRDRLRRGEFAMAVTYARESRKLVESSLESHREARYPLMECVKAIKLAEALGADVQNLNGMLAEAKLLFRQNELDLSSEHSRELLDLARKAAYGRAAESYELAEKAMTLAKKIVADVSESEAKLRKSRELLERDEFAKSVSMSCASMFESDSAIANALTDKLKNIDEFAIGIERDVDSLTEVQEAIESSKERNLENLRNYANQSEGIVSEAYESAAAYARVAQDVVKQAYERSVQVSPLNEMVSRETDRLELPSQIVSTDGRRSDMKRHRLIDMFMTGKVSESQLDKLLLMIDSTIEKDNLV